MTEVGDGIASTLTRSERKRAGQVERVARAAARVFAQKGYEGANFDLIAAELDLRGPSLYYYFSTKEELFLRCVQKSADEVFGRLRAVAESGLDPIETLRALFREQVLIVVRDYPEFVPLFFKTYLPVHELREAVLELRREHAMLFEETAWQIQHWSKANRAEIRIWLGAAYGTLAYLPEWYDPSGEIGVDVLAAEVADLLVKPFLA
ncbi:TetR/AcrR family transcriptional regulator [Rhodococcus jostii]|uniref:TetR/AcrR family transcriptional regulator n=1 Tax=Rhodococcus jostii TaxID=132919 RepID=UPI003667C5CD